MQDNIQDPFSICNFPGLETGTKCDRHRTINTALDGMIVKGHCWAMGSTTDKMASWFMGNLIGHDTHKGTAP